MSYRDPSLALQDGVYRAISDLAGGSVFYRVPQNQPLPYIVFGDDDLTPVPDRGGEFTEATANIEVFAADKIDLKTLVAAVVNDLTGPIALDGFMVLEWHIANINYRTWTDGLTEQASIEIDYLLQPTE